MSPATPPVGRILVAEDRPVNREVLCQYVRELGHLPTPAENGRAALELLRRQPFDLVLLDVLMPELDGFQVLEQLRADERLRPVPVIVVTGLDEVDSVVRCIEAGAVDYLAKPFDPVLLRARINACLEKKRLQDQERQRTQELEETLRQLKAAQDQLVMREKMASLGELMAGIAHEIRNPLNFVTNFAALALEQLGELRAALGPQPAPAQALLADITQGVAKIEEHGRRANQIITSMLLHARGESGRRQPADLNALVAEAVTLAYHGFRGRDPTVVVELELALDPALAPLAVFPQELGRVLLNLAQNACYAAHSRKATAGRGFVPRVTVRTLDRGGEVEVSVRDNGNGVPVAVRDKIFQPFFTTKPPGVGTGLGLSLSYDIVVQMHGGRIRVESEEGQFAEFIVTLPRGKE